MLQKTESGNFNSFTIAHKLRNKIRLQDEANILVSKKAKVVNCSIVVHGKNNTLIIDDYARVRGVTIEIMGDNCLLYIGEESMVGDNCYLSVKENGRKLVIGKDCGLSRNVKVMTSDGHPVFKENERINIAADIVIEDHVWIADNVTILKGVTIGYGSVIGINSTVVKSISDRCVAVGNPARTVHENIEWRDKF